MDEDDKDIAGHHSPDDDENRFDDDEEDEEDERDMFDEANDDYVKTSVTSKTPLPRSATTNASRMMVRTI